MKAVEDFDTLVPQPARSAIRAAGLAGFPSRDWLAGQLRSLRRTRGNASARAAVCWLVWIGTYPVKAR